MKRENELGLVLEREDTGYGDAYQEFKDATDALRAHPEIDKQI